MAGRKENSIAELDTEIERLTDGAKNAKASGDMDLAREAVQRIVKLNEQRDADQKLINISLTRSGWKLTTVCV